MRQGSAAARIAEDPFDVHRMLGMARLRRDLPGAQGQGGVGRGAVPDVRHAPDQGDRIPFEAADALHRSCVRDQPGARRRCENYEECNTGYPLPQYGKLTATDEVCEHCGAPMVIVTTNRGPWKLCPNFDCPGKEQDKDKGAKKGASAKKGTKRSTAKKK